MSRLGSLFGGFCGNAGVSSACLLEWVSEQMMVGTKI